MNYSKKSVNTEKKGNNYGKRERIMDRLCHNTTHPGRNVNPFTLSSLLLSLL